MDVPDTRLVAFDDVQEPEPGMRYTDRLGHWFMSDGTEIIPVGTEAVERAVELVIGTFDLRSNNDAIDGRLVEISFPALTTLIQHDWQRVVEGEPGVLPDRGFLIAYESSAAAVGRLAEELVCDLTLDLVGTDLWGERALVSTVRDAIDQGHLVLPGEGVRSDDLSVLEDHHCVALIESKSTHGTWASLRRAVRKGTVQLTATASINPTVTSGAILAISLTDHQIGLATFSSDQMADGTATSTWAHLHRTWYPRR